MLKLYDSELSGNCHKVRMMLGILDLAYEKAPVNWFKDEHRSPAYRAINPRAQLPALEDDGLVIWDSQAILVYLARRYGGETWLPMDAVGIARVMQWLMLANEEIRALAWARVAVRLGRGREQLPQLQETGLRGLAVLEERLAAHDWVALDRASIADLACFPYVALSREAGTDLEHFSAVCRWVERVKSLPGYVGMPGIA